MKVRIYLRYFIVTIQLCLLPHMSYCSINALYNSSLTSQVSAMNVCLAIFITAYLIGFIASLFIFTKSLTPNSKIFENIYKKAQ